MNSEKLSLDHIGMLYGRLKEAHTHVSEYSFANLYLFREAHDYEVIFDREIFVFGVTYDGLRYIMPTRDVRTMESGYLKKMMREFGVLFPIPEEWMTAFNGEEFEFSALDGDTDYIFTVEKIKTYAGKKLHSKRNLLQQFMDNYEHTVAPLTPGLHSDAIAVLDAWQAESGMTKNETDYYPCMEALQLQDKLVLCGGIYYAENEPAGFILGEEINEKMFALHFAKGIRKFKGIYQFMYNNCAKVMPAHYTFINFEQDLGKISLRQAKSSYIPDMMVKKYRVRLK